MALLILENNLRLARCPFCNVDNPNLTIIHECNTKNSEAGQIRLWRMYVCARCGGVVTASTDPRRAGHIVEELFPASEQASEKLPAKAKSYLQQAIESLHAPAGSIMLTASSVDAMLKSKGYKDGGLYARIEKAAKDHLITEDMAKWAHQVRLEANDQRHADDDAPLPSDDDAKRCIHFAKALGQFLFELPALIAEGLKESQPKETKKE